MAECFEIRLNGNPTLVETGATVAVAILRSGSSAFHRSLRGEPRGFVCGMGVCGECQCTINGVEGEPACQRLREPGMTVQGEAVR